MAVERKEMQKVTRESLLTLEAYAKARPDIRAKVIAHKKNRTLHLGEHLTLIFEDEMTIRYQIQEMLRAEKTFEEAGIQDELEAYNPLIPDGSNWKATMMIEYSDPQVRAAQLGKLKGIEDRIWVKAGHCAPVYAIADEDLERENAEKTSAVHFLRFELPPDSVVALKQGESLSIGVDHAAYSAVLNNVPAAVRDSLVQDLA